MVASKLYEGMFLFDSNLAAKDWPGLERHIQDLLQKNSAELVYSERWPDRKLAYEIRGMKKGTYYLTYFKAPPSSIQGIKRDTELSERVVRVLILHDESLEADCEKRISREITGSPEEIEERREKLRRENQEPGRDLTGGPPPVPGEAPAKLEEAASSGGAREEAPERQLE
jgi:ribosomal protein S6